MKYLAMILALGFFANHALANDGEHMDSEKTSKNPVTGTVTTKKKMKRKGKDMAGNTHTTEVTETTKHKKDGSTSHEVEATEEHDHK